MVPAVITKYLPERMYGFLSTEGGETVFFYLDSFSPGLPPITGESVLVDIYPETDKKSKRAKKVLRTKEPVSLQGTIEKFNPHKGFGFIRWDGGDCFFHKSEVENLSPVIGSKVSFYLGRKEGNPRACYVRPLESM